MSKAEEIKNARTRDLLALPDTRFIRFKGACLVSAPGTRGFRPIGGERFSHLAYEQFGYGISRGSILDLEHAITNMAPDWTDTSHLIGFGDKVWDMRKLAFTDEATRYVYSSAVQPNSDPAEVARVRAYLTELAGGDAELAFDYLQLAAPLFMYDRPVGVIWVIGAGANGKSAYLDALELIIGDHFAHLTMEMIEDGRATPALRGVLGNVVSETSEKRVEDMQRYKNMGAHEPFQVRILGSHDVVTIETTFHTIFSANNIPAFADKTMGSRRRTLLVPFPATFADDPQFKQKTFTRPFIGALLHLMLEAAKIVGEKGYQWSAASQAVQTRYNEEANTAEAFARYLDELHIVGFKNYSLLNDHYQTWCSAQSFNGLGRTQFLRAIEETMKPKLSVERDEKSLTVRRYYVEGRNKDNTVWFENGYAYPAPDSEAVQQQINLEGVEVHEW